MHRDLPALKNQLKQLQEEQERLTDKVARAKQVAAGLPDADSYRELCAALRRQHDEEVSISQQLQVGPGRVTMGLPPAVLPSHKMMAYASTHAITQ